MCYRSNSLVSRWSWRGENPRKRFPCSEERVIEMLLVVVVMGMVVMGMVGYGCVPCR